MGKIRLLSEAVASQVAAGEVVERPASVVKELVENSIDAGARRITIEFIRGGTQLIRVTDDGSGMDREDALLCLERHATSKIQTAEDLSRVATMGFRGEAVPSIASVSRFRLVTRPHGAVEGTEIVIAGGKVESVNDSGEAPGTSIEVRSLFFNLPARRKFLRGEQTEAAHILHQIQSLALAHPEVAISVIREGRKVMQVAASRDLGIRIRDLLGVDFFNRLMALENCEENGIRLSGFIAKPSQGRPDREQQFVILNGRVVQCPAIHQSLREAYAEALPRGHHPLAVLSIRMDPLAFDCNVHPAKREVRFHRPDLVRQAVFVSTRRILDDLKSRKVAVAPLKESFQKETSKEVLAPASPPPTSSAAFLPPPQVEMKMNPSQETSSAPEEFRLIGGLGNYWILLESSEGLVLMDTRAASERILFETLRRESAAGAASAQRLLIPTVVELTPKDAAWISENLTALQAAGFSIEPFGGSSFKIEAMPVCLAERDARDALLELCELLRVTGSQSSGQPALETLIRSVSRLAASDGFSYDEQRSRRLVRELLRCELPYACPRGRPTMIQWSFSELDRKFGR